MNLIDTHCHLVSEQLKDDLQEHLIQAYQVGVKRIINVAYSPNSVTILLDQLSIEPQSNQSIIYATVGIQPHDAKTYTQTELMRIQQIASSCERIIAIGEIGLDKYYELSPMSIQIECFEAFLALALKLNLPVVVHMRETHADVLMRMSAFTKQGGTGVIHCFTGTLKEAYEFLDCGLYISLSGIITFKKSVNLVTVAKSLPNDRILIETDSPYLSPMPLRAKLNTPAQLLHTCQFIAKIRNLSPEDFAEQSTKNALRLFSKMR